MKTGSDEKNAACCNISESSDDLSPLPPLQPQLPSQGLLPVGCPRNNQIFFSVRTETNRNSICFGCFSVCFAKQKNFFFGLFRFVSVFRTSIETTETNRIFSKQTEKNQKNPPKNVIYKRVLETVNFFSRFEPKTSVNKRKF